MSYATPPEKIIPDDPIGSLYVDNQRWLQRWLHRKLGCAHRASDLLQDTFVRLLAREEDLNAREPRAYLMTVAKRVLIDHWRRAHIEQVYLEAVAQLPEAVAPDPQEQMLLLETLVEIDRMLDGLPALTKRVFLLVQLDGLKQADIADRLGISVSTVKRHLVTAATQCYFIRTADGTH